MELHEIFIGVLIFVIAVYIGIKTNEFHKNKYHNDSWKNRNK